MTKTACIINDYYDSTLTTNAIKSVYETVDYIIVVNYVKPFEEINDDSIIYLTSNEKDVGKRYIYGLNQIKADYYFLLDYDDTFEYNKIYTLLEMFDSFNIIKENDYYNINKDLMYNVIVNHIDWHISKYSFNDSFKKYLVDFINNHNINTSASFDKVLFAIMLSYGNYYITNEHLTNKIKHNDSKMHITNMNQFYNKTIEVFKSLNINRNYYNKNYINYIDYNIYLNKFLANKTLKDYNLLINNFDLPIKRKLFYKMLVRKEK